MTSIDELRAIFATPGSEFGPTPLWWWSGDTVTNERIEWQLERFVAGGIRNLVVMNLAPAGPQYEMPVDDPLWFSEEWWDRFTFTCERAKELGVRIWFYDQIGFSGANIQGRITGEHPQFVGQSLTARCLPADAAGVPLAAGEQLIALFDADRCPVEFAADGEPRRVPGCTGESLPDPGSIRPRGQQPAGDLLAIVATPTAFDYLSKPAVAALMDTIHGEFQRRVPQFLGNVIAGSFQDELPATNSWSADFVEEFRARKGYDLLAVCYALFDYGSRRQAKIRADYYDVRAQLAEEALFRPLGQWHDERGMLVGADQTNPARAGYPIESSQLYVDYFRTHRHLNAVGSDHEGDAKIHSSMAHLYGHDRVWLEAFHSTGWGGTLEETWDWLLPFFRSGASLYNPHATYFDTRAGFFEWAPPATDWRQPYWAHYPQFAAAIERTCALMTWGQYDAEVAVLFPSATAHTELTLDLPIDFFDATGRPERPNLDAMQQTFLDLVGSNNWFRTRIGALDAAGVAFDVIDEDSIQRADTTGGVLSVAGMGYRTVILPRITAMHAPTAEALTRFADAGGRVIVIGRPPSLAAGLNQSDAGLAALASHPGIEVCADVSAAMTLVPRQAQQVYADDVPLLVRRQGQVGIALVPGAFPNATAYPLRAGRGQTPVNDYDFDRSRYATSRTITIRGVVETAELWDPATGEQRPVDLEQQRGRAIAHLDTGGAPMTFLVWRCADARLESAVPQPDGQVDAAALAPDAQVDAATSAGDRVMCRELREWTGELVPTADNTWGDFAVPAGAPMDRPQMWRMHWREDEPADPGIAPAGEVAAVPADCLAQASDSQPPWRHVAATFGQRVAIHPPARHNQLPRPLGPADCRSLLTGPAEIADLDHGWQIREFSLSRGIERDGISGGKGIIPQEFVRVPAPTEGEYAIVRTFVRTDYRGQADLILGSSAIKRAWWNGVEVPFDDAYCASGSITIEADLNVLEYWLGAPRTPPERADEELGSFFSLAAPGAFTERPEYMVFSQAQAGSALHFRTEIPALSGITRARLVVGSARTATVWIDHTRVARQEKVEYYNADARSLPHFFSHDVTELVGGGGQLRIELAGASDHDVVWVDLAIWHAGGVWTRVSGPGWQCHCGEHTGLSEVWPFQWLRAESCYALARPHPLPEASWLNGPPEIGQESIPFAATTSTRAARQHYRLHLPSGTEVIRLPLRLPPAQARLAGASLPIPAAATAQPETYRINLAEPLPTATDLELDLPAHDFWRGGSAWLGPASLEVRPAAIELGPWADQGLAGWSGGVRYRHRLGEPVDSGAILDLGQVRGSVQVAVDGEVIGTAFCAPFRFTLPACAAGAEIDVTVLNTLGPFFAEATSSHWVFPAQIASGLSGPVAIRPAP